MDEDEGPDEMRYTLNAMAFPFHHGSHYSSPPLVIYYLIRLQPYTDLGINLQGGKFDKADRIFSSLGGTWDLVCWLDSKELTPEFYSFEDMLVNINRRNFGVTQSLKQVDHVQLPDWAHENYWYFIQM